MDLVGLILFVAIPLVLIYLFYGLHINEKTYKQRVGWIHLPMSWEQKRLLLNEIDKVSYHQHYLSLWWHRNPLKMYSQEFRNLIENQTGEG